MLAIIIVNYKSEARTVKYVEEELGKIGIPHVIVVVNNSATDESNQVLAKALNAPIVDAHEMLSTQGTGVYIVPHQDNLGFAKGNNLGAEFSMKNFDIDYFLFTNNDIRLESVNVVEKLLAKLEMLKGVGMIGPRVIGLDGKEQSPEPYYPFWKRYVWMYWMTPFLSTEKKIKLFQLDYPEKAKEGIHYKLMGSFFMVKADDFVSCGMMDSNTFLFGEEVILTERLKAIGKDVYYDPSVTVVHEHGATISNAFKQKRILRTQFKSESYYYRTYRGISQFSLWVGRLSVEFYLLLKIRHE